VCIVAGKHLSNACLIQSGLKQGDAFSTLLFNNVTKNTSNVKDNQNGLKMNSLLSNGNQDLFPWW